MSAILINLLAIGFIAFTVWWFWMAKPNTRKANAREVLEVVVDNGVYTPGTIETTVNQPLTLSFLRKDASPCAEKVLFSGLDISRDLPLNEPVEVSLTPTKPGDYEFTCQMGMYRGHLKVKESA